jgi:hypothetical protein
MPLAIGKFRSKLAPRPEAICRARSICYEARRPNARSCGAELRLVGLYSRLSNGSFGAAASAGAAGSNASYIDPTGKALFKIVD